MTTQRNSSPNASRKFGGQLAFAFDVGHSSIGWSVLTAPERDHPEILGCGVVLFEKDSALACQRRQHRRQRRHIRATRQRIARMEKLFMHIGALTREVIESKHRAGGGNSAPWLLAARVLASNGQKTLSWQELWDVLRWYAHNRGYEPVSDEAEADKEDIEKVENAKREMGRLGTVTMAETITAWLGLDTFGKRAASRENYKARNCAFDRGMVVAEVRRILEAHVDRLPGLDERVVKAILDDVHAIEVPSIRWPRRYRGGFLFGRLATRYHNRIIGKCPISGAKLPKKRCREFLCYRWAMLLANIRVVDSDDGRSRPLSREERSNIHKSMERKGYLTPGDLKRLVGTLPGVKQHNVDQIVVHPDAGEALVFDPIRKLIVSNERVAAVWETLPPQVKKRATGKWRRGKSLNLAALRAEVVELGHDVSGFDSAVTTFVSSRQKTRRRSRTHSKETVDDIIEAPIDARRDLAKLSGRAPYARQLLDQAFKEVMDGKDPRARGGCLEETEEVRRRREERPIAEQTNNHLVRHRLQILGRLLNHLIEDPAYGANRPERIRRITIEVNRDLREMAGRTSQEIAKELGARVANHKKVANRLFGELPEGTRITGSLIRKARIADDLGWRCPYTGVEFEPVDLVEGRVDRDHIIPRSQRMSDSLDSLVITFSAVNKWKGQRTAWQFIQEEGGKPVPDAPNLSIVTPARFRDFVEHLDTKGHRDDYRRKKRRKELLLLERYEERTSGFTPGQLTQTSQLARLAAQILRTPFNDTSNPPEIVSLPGFVTATVRRSWDVLGCLSQAAPGVLNTDGSTRSKTEIRNITHLHHALDACVIGLASHFIPNRGDVWRLLAQRNLRAWEKQQLADLGVFDFDAHGGLRLRDLPQQLKEQLRQRLTERRVVQHVPADMNGMRVEENTRGIVRREDGRVYLRQKTLTSDGRRNVKNSDELDIMVVGLNAGGKLAELKGIRVVKENFGVAILENTSLPSGDRFVIIPHVRVWKQLQELRMRNGGKPPEVWRKGQIVRIPSGNREGKWRIFSVMASNRGIMLKLDRPDSPSFDDSGGASGFKMTLTSLIKRGTIRLETRLTGS